MYRFVALLLMLPLISSAQDTTTSSCKLIRETDPFTKQTKLSTGFLFVKGGSVTVDADSKEIDVLFSIEGIDQCFDNNSTAFIFFDGVKSKVTVRNGGTMNCEGLFHFIFRNSTSTYSTLQKIMSQKIDHILFTGNNKKETTLTISPDKQELLMTLAACLVNEARELIR